MMLDFAGHPDGLKRLLGKIHISPAVHYQLPLKTRDKNYCSTHTDFTFIKEKSLDMPIPEFRYTFDLGRLEMLILFQQLWADWQFPDDKQAQKEADLWSSPDGSAFAQLMNAFQNAFIANFDPTIQLLPDQQIWVNKELKTCLFYKIHKVKANLLLLLSCFRKELNFSSANFNIKF